MPTLKSEGRAIADELIDFEFADFRSALSFTVTNGGAFDPVTEIETGGLTTVYTYQAIPDEIKMHEWQGTDVQITDIPVIYTRVDSFKPKTGDTCEYDGCSMQIVAVMLDSSGATVKLIMRAL